MSSTLICCDKFKGTLDAKSVNKSIKDALESYFIPRSISCATIPLSDGGEGFLDNFLELFREEKRDVVIAEEEVTGPRGAKVLANFIIYDDEGIKTAIIEMSRCCGLCLLSEANRNPLFTTSKGVGELMRKVVGKYHCKNILLGIGGSATNDCGIGALQALGVSVFLSENGKEVLLEQDFTGSLLSSVKRFEVSQNSIIGTFQLRVACDVDAPLFGRFGAAKVFAKQKGASETEIDFLESGMRHVASLLPKNVSEIKGAGAAGGICGGLKAFLDDNMEIISGADLILSTTKLEEKVKDANIVFTGEGKVDKSTFQGKVVEKVIGF